MTLRQQQVAVFLATVVIIFGIFAAGLWLIAQRLTQEATLQTALLLARQVEIALADSLQQRPANPPQSSSFWNFLGNIFPGKAVAKPRSPSRRTEVKGLMQAFLDRSGGIEAMWVLNPEGKVLYSSLGRGNREPLTDPGMQENLRRGIATINSQREGKSVYYDVLVPLQMPRGVRGPGGLRLWINPADWTELLSGLGRQLSLLFGLGAGVALLSASLMTTLYTRRFRLISETLRQAEAGTYQARPQYASQDEVGASLDLIDRLVMRQREATSMPAPVQRMAVAARTLAHEVRTPLNALAIHLELLRNASQASDNSTQQEKSMATLDTSIRQVDRLIRDFSDYTAPVTMQREPLDLSTILGASLEAIKAPCTGQNIALIHDLSLGPWPLKGDATRLRQVFDNLLRNAMEAQPEGGTIRIAAQINGSRLTIDFHDSGPGIPLERREGLFDFGKSTKPGGSGIGLPLSQLIVESHRGSLEYLDSDVYAEGATFRMVFPLDKN